MAFEYNGFIHRDIEPQVRYDAEQVQLLKQADVTINENLQTVNTELDGKLTKPTNPSSESAVTLLADGTVGTKLLSEIGGSGGKLYLHSVSISYSELAGAVTITIINNSPLVLTSASISIYGVMVGTWAGPEWRGVTTVFSGGTNLIGVLVTLGSETPYCLSGSYTISDFSDEVTEL